MTNEVATIDERRLPVVRSLMIESGTLENYQLQTLDEARERVRMRALAVEAVERELADAERGLAAAEYADVEWQIQLYRNQISSRRNVRTRRANRLEDAKKFLSLIEDGYLPIPTLEATRVEWVRDPIPPEALEILGTEQAHERFREFAVVGMAPRWAERGRRRGVDPILVGVCDGEMFPLAWWR